MPTTDWIKPPNGYTPFLSEASLMEIHKNHFISGGAGTDKSVFNETVDTNKLVEIFTAGMRTTSPTKDWFTNEHGYYERNFSFSGVGKKAVNAKGERVDSNEIVLSVESAGPADQSEALVITMYPN